jgi:hypothetical protein
MELTADVANFHAQSLLDPPDFAPLHTPTLTCAAADHHRIPAPPQSAAGGRPAGHTGRMRRVLVVGMSGAGKTTAARRVGAKLGLPFHEMDALALGPNWSQPPGLVDEVKRITAEPAWIFDSWGYPAVRI